MFPSISRGIGHTAKEIYKKDIALCHLHADAVLHPQWMVMVDCVRNVRKMVITVQLVLINSARFSAFCNSCFVNTGLGENCC